MTTTTKPKERPLSTAKFLEKTRAILNPELASTAINTCDYALARNQLKQRQYAKAIRFAEQNLHLKSANKLKVQWTRQLKRLKESEGRWKKWLGRKN